MSGKEVLQREPLIAIGFRTSFVYQQTQHLDWSGTILTSAYNFQFFSSGGADSPEGMGHYGPCRGIAAYLHHRQAGME